MNIPIESDHRPASKKMLIELRGELKSDISRLEEKMNSGFSEVKSEIHEIKSEIHEMKSDIHGVKSEIQGVKADIHGVKSEIQEVKADTHRTKFIVEELSRDVKAHMQSFALIYEKQMEQDQEQKGLKKRMEKLELSR